MHWCFHSDFVLSMNSMEGIGHEEVRDGKKTGKDRKEREKRKIRRWQWQLPVWNGCVADSCLSSHLIAYSDLREQKKLSKSELRHQALYGREGFFF